MAGIKRWETPPDFFRPRWELHRFNVDAFASDANALIRPSDRPDWTRDGNICGACAREHRGSGRPLHYIGRYYTEETDGLDPSHYVAGESVWGNPPFDYTIVKAVPLFRELAMDGGVTSELLLPASAGAGWFMKHLWNDEAGHWRDGVDGHFVGRVQFLLDGKVPLGRNGKPQSSRQENLLVTLKARAK